MYQLSYLARGGMKIQILSIIIIIVTVIDHNNRDAYCAHIHKIS